MFENKVMATIGTFVLTGIIILIEHFNGGVVSHHLLASEDLPKFSNWWGLITIPVLTLIVYSLIDRRERIATQRSELRNINNTKWKYRFLYALLFGLTLSVLWEFGYENVLQYLILLPFLIAVFKPVHLPEFLLGFVIGKIYTFGGILPIIFGLVILIICLIINKLVNVIKTLFASTSSYSN